MVKIRIIAYKFVANNHKLIRIIAHKIITLQLHIRPQGHSRIRIKIRINAHKLILTRILINYILIKKITIIGYNIIVNNHKRSKYY